jgi:hypothetical protein
MNFPRNKWLDVKLCGDGLGIYFLKWGWRIIPGRARRKFGLGVCLELTPNNTLAIYLGFWNVYIDNAITYTEWPWNRKGKS